MDWNNYLINLDRFDWIYPEGFYVYVLYKSGLRKYNISSFLYYITTVEKSKSAQNRVEEDLIFSGIISNRINYLFQRIALNDLKNVLPGFTSRVPQLSALGNTFWSGISGYFRGWLIFSKTFCGEQGGKIPPCLLKSRNKVRAYLKTLNWKINNQITQIFK